MSAYAKPHVLQRVRACWLLWLAGSSRPLDSGALLQPGCVHEHAEKST